MICTCGNAARYIDETGAFTCAICPLKTRRDSIRLADVPQLLAWARRYLEIHQRDDDTTAADLRAIIGRKPT